MKPTAANTPLLAAIKRVYNAAIYKKALGLAREDGSLMATWEYAKTLTREEYRTDDVMQTRLGLDDRDLPWLVRKAKIEAIHADA